MHTLFFLAMLTIATARADEPAPPPDEIEDSADADPLAIARKALEQADAATRAVGGVKGRIKGLEEIAAIHGTDIGILTQKVKDLEEAGAPQADIETVKAELARLLAEGKAYAEAAKASAESAKREADRAATAAASTPAGVYGSLDSAPLVDNDERDPRGYGSVGVGPGWLARQASYMDDGSGVLTPATDELSSGVLGLVAEAGYGGFDERGRLNLGGRAIADYNVGGGWHLGGEVVFGGFVEQAHVFRLEALAGLSWETIPTDDSEDYADRRWLVGIGAELVPVEHWSVLFTGRFLPDNALDGSHAGEVNAYVRARF